MTSCIILINLFMITTLRLLPSLIAFSIILQKISPRTWSLQNLFLTSFVEFASCYRMSKTFSIYFFSADDSSFKFSFKFAFYMIFGKTKQRFSIRSNLAKMTERSEGGICKLVCSS